MPLKPITPKEANARKLGSLPDFIIAAFNESITKHYDGKKASFQQNEVIDIILAKPEMVGKSRDVIFNNHWLDVELVFEQFGWKVEYDKPAYNETYVAKFIFTKQ